MSRSRSEVPFGANTPIDNQSRRTVRRVERLKSVIEKRQPTLHLLLEDVDDPHNVSAVLRSCDAVGVGTVHLLYPSNNFPKLGHDSSAGVAKWIKIHHHLSVSEAVDFLHSKNCNVISTTLGEESQSLFDTDLTAPVALCFGNEHRGVSAELAELSDANMLIPMVGLVESLNISVACAVSLFEALRQRNRAGLYDAPQLDQEGVDKMLLDWTTK